MQLKPETSRLGSRPGWRERRRLRTTTKYRQIQEFLGTSDEETVLLLRLGDLQTAEAGQMVTRQAWSRSHIVVGLSARLGVGAYTEVTAPWLIDDRGQGAEVKISQTGLVLFIDRRHRHLVNGALAGRVEPVAPIAKAVDKYPKPERAPQDASTRKLEVVSTASESS